MPETWYAIHTPALTVHTRETETAQHYSERGSVVTARTVPEGYGHE